MLKIKINNSSYENSEEELNLSSVTFSDATQENVLVTTKRPHRLMDNDEIHITRAATYKTYNSYVSPTVVDDYKFTFPAFPDRNVGIKNVSKELVHFGFDENKKPIQKMALIIEFNDDHTFMSSNDSVNYAEIIDEYYYDIEDSELTKRKRCGGDYVLFDYFGFKTERELTKDKKYVLTEEFTNDRTNTFDIILGDETIPIGGEFEYPVVNYGYKTFYIDGDGVPTTGSTSVTGSTITGGTSVTGSTVTGGTEEIRCTGEVSYIPYFEPYGYVPKDEFGNNIMNTIILFYPDDVDTKGNKEITIKYDRIATNFLSMLCILPDNRFYNKYPVDYEYYDEIYSGSTTGSTNVTGTTSGETWYDVNYGMEWFDESKIFKRIGDIHLDFKVSDSFDPSTNKQDSLINNFLEEITQDAVSDIIDYEKQMFTPMYMTFYNSGVTFNDKWLKPVRKINFNLHFRSRTDEYGVGDDESGELVREWVTDDSLHWNNFTYDPELRHLVPSANVGISDYSVVDPNYSQKADLLKYLNFTDDDVYYQKKKLNMSFIRLSFYDSKDRRTQALQFYSTIFLDSGKIFTQYVNNANKYHIADVTKNEFIKNVNGKLVLNDSERLSAKFSCADKYNLQACSEGFYLYMFPSLVKNNELTDIYMKVEFNHAKYGRVVPFTYPCDENDIPIPWDSTKFPIHYTDIVNGRIVGLKTKQLYDDQYIHLKVKYDFEHNQYVWFLPRTISNGDELNFNLFEPRLNGSEDYEQKTEYESVEEPDEPTPEEPVDSKLTCCCCEDNESDAYIPPSVAFNHFSTTPDNIEIKHEFEVTYRVTYQEAGDVVSIKRLISDTTYSDVASGDIFDENTKIFIKAITATPNRNVIVKINGTIVELNGESVYTLRLTDDTDISIYFDTPSNIPS